jgi:hypothetical protein
VRLSIAWWRHVPLVSPIDFNIGATGFASEIVRKEGVCFITISDRAAMGAAGGSLQI